MQDIIAIAIAIAAAAFLAYQAWLRFWRHSGNSCASCGSCSVVGGTKTLPLVNISLGEPLESGKTTSGRLTSAPADLSEKWACLTERWLKYTIDLSNIDSPQDFETALFKGLDISPKDVKYPWMPNARHALWAAYQSATDQENPHDGKIIHFVGWGEFAKRMPRHARRLRHMFGTYSKQHPYALQLEFT